MNEWMNEWTNERTNEWMNEQMNEQTNERLMNVVKQFSRLKLLPFSRFFTIPHAICSICVRRVGQNGPTLFESLSNTEWQLKWCKLHEKPTSNYGVMPGYVSRAITIL